MHRTIDEKKIKQEAKELLEKFAKTLESVEKESDEEYIIDRDEFTRKEKDGVMPDIEFKERFLENAPKHDSDFVIAEKGEWKK